MSKMTESNTSPANPLQGYQPPGAVRAYLPEHAQRMWLELYELARKQGVNQRHSEMRAWQFFLEGKQLEFVVYPDRHAAESGPKNWLRRCTCCGVICDLEAVFVHAPDCEVRKVETGEIDPAEFMISRGFGM